MTDAMLRIEDLTVELKSGGFVVRPVDHLSADVASGELALLLGPSGCGKTTLLSCLAGILSPTSGTVRFDGQPITSLRGASLSQYRRRTVGIVFQSFNLVPSLTAAENVEVPLLAGGSGPAASRKRALELLERVGLGDRVRHRPGELSGGQQQRVAIARALAWDPPLLLADEPTAHLDYVQVEDVLRLLRDLAKPGRVVVVSTHDERMLGLADQVVAMVPEFEAGRGKARQIDLSAGEVLFEEASRGDRIYLVNAGEIELVRRREDGVDVAIHIAGPGSVVGEMGPVFGLPRSATARARIDARVTGYTVRQFRELPGGVTKLASVLGSRMGGADPVSTPRRRAPLRAAPRRKG
jgi:putative ABC transport system ATP-binding protein